MGLKGFKKIQEFVDTELNKLIDEQVDSGFTCLLINFDKYRSTNNPSTVKTLKNLIPKLDYIFDISLSEYPDLECPLRETSKFDFSILSQKEKFDMKYFKAGILRKKGMNKDMREFEKLVLSVDEVVKGVIGAGKVNGVKEVVKSLIKI